MDHEGANGFNRRKRSARRHQINDREANRPVETTNEPRNDDKETTNEPRNDDKETTNKEEVAKSHPLLDSMDESLSLSLGSASYSSHSQIPPVTTNPSLRLAPPSPSVEPVKTTSPTPTPDGFDFMASSLPYSMGTPPYFPPSWLSRSQGSFPPPPAVNRFSLVPPPNLTAPGMRPAMMTMMMMNTAPPVRNSRSQSVVNHQKSDTIPPPFPWATNVRGVVHSLEYLESKEITTITGEVQCKHCEQVYEVSYDLREKFAVVEMIFARSKRIMRERAPRIWLSPEQRRCELCGREKAVKPVIAERKSQINWLFLLMGQTLGFCTLEQLKNFCKHSKSHRTGAKDRVLYLTYLGLCKMLDPENELFKRCGDTPSKR